MSEVVRRSLGTGSSGKAAFLAVDHALKFRTAHEVLVNVFFGTKPFERTSISLLVLKVKRLACCLKDLGYWFLTLLHLKVPYRQHLINDLDLDYVVSKKVI